MSISARDSLSIGGPQPIIPLMAGLRRLLAAASMLIVATSAFSASAAFADSTSPVEPVPISAVTHTRVTVTFTGNGCVGCMVTPTQLILADDNSGREVSWNTDFSLKRKVRGDSVSFVVPTESTRGMTFMIEAPPTSSGAFYGAVPLVVFQYAGFSPGEWVERSQVVQTSSGSPCWSGTTQSAVSLSVNVRAVKRRGLNDTPGESDTVRVPIAWVAPTESALGGFAKTDKGIVAAQDVFPCGGS